MFTKQELILEKNQKFSWVSNSALILLSSMIMALFANVSIPLQPVPIAIQPHIALLIGAILGPRRGALAIGCFLMQGLAGLPVFPPGAIGLARLIGPTGGYLIGYLVGAYFVGWMLSRFKERSVSKTFLAFALGNLIIYLLGVSYLSTFIGLQKSFLLGVCPFLIGDLLKTVLSVKIFGWFSRKIAR